jgi:hypothetical protein
MLYVESGFTLDNKEFLNVCKKHITGQLSKCNGQPDIMEHFPWLIDWLIDYFYSFNLHEEFTEPFHFFIGVRARKQFCLFWLPKLWILRYPAHRYRAVPSQGFEPTFAGIWTHDPLVESPTS